MPQNLRDQSLELLLERITGLAAMATKGDVQSIMAVVARCTIEVSDSLKETAATIATEGERLQIATRSTVAELSAVSEGVSASANQIEATAREIHEFNNSTTKLTSEVIRLNRRLFWATVVIAIATAIGAGVAIGALFKHS